MSFHIQSNGTLANVKADIKARSEAANVPPCVEQIIEIFCLENVKNAPDTADHVDSISVEASGHFGGGPGMSRSSCTIKIEPYLAAPAPITAQ